MLRFKPYDTSQNLLLRINTGSLCGSLLLKSRQELFLADVKRDNPHSMKWQVTFYNEKVEEETLGFPKGILANFIHIVEMIEDFGPTLGKPYTAPMGDGLFEIRAKGKEGIGRSLYCTMVKKEIVILNSSIKKSQKTPKKELDLAKKRMKEVKK